MSYFFFHFCPNLILHAPTSASDNVAEKMSQAQKEINRTQQVELMQTGSQKSIETLIPEKNSKVTEISDMQKRREISSAKKV